MADFEPNEPDAGKNVFQWWYWGGTQQAWRLDFSNPAPKVDARPAECVGFPANTFYHVIARHSNLALRQLSATESNLVQSNILPGELDNWRLVAVGSGHYLIVNHNSGQAISVDEDGLNLTTGAPNDSSEWCFASVGEGYYNVRNRKTGYSIDIQNWSYDHLGNAALSLIHISEPTRPY